MPINSLSTNVAKKAVQNYDVSLDGAENVEKLAQATKDLGDANKTLGLRGDAFEMASRSPAYQALRPGERELFAKVFNEMLGQVSGGFGTASGQDGITPATLKAAFHELNNVVERMVAYSKRHGPGSNAPNLAEPGLDPLDHPEYIINNSHRVKGVFPDNGDDPYLFVTFKTDDLGSQRTRYNLAEDDVTPESMIKALRKAMGGAFDEVDIRAVSERDYQNGVEPISLGGASGVDPAPQLTGTDLFLAAVDKFNDAAASGNVPAGLDVVTEVGHYMPELSDSYFVVVPPGTDKKAVQEKFADWLDANNFSDTVSRNYLGNTIYVMNPGGAMPV